MAEELLTEWETGKGDDCLTAAQVHATLAHVAALVLQWPGAVVGADEEGETE